MAKKKKASSKKKKVGGNSYVSVWEVVPITTYEIRCNGNVLWWDLEDDDDAYRTAYDAALRERKKRGLPQGSMKVIFPQPVK